MKRYKSYALLLLGSMIATTSSAAVVEHGTYFSDLTSGLDWLELTETINLSINDVNAQFGSGGDFDGWRYANSDQLTDLVLSVAGTPDVQVSASISRYNNEQLDDLIGHFGVTWDYSGKEYAWGNIINANHMSGSVFTQGILKDVQANGTYDTFSSTHGGNQSGQRFSIVGNYLIRDSMVVSAVPIPAAIWLMGSGLVGLLGVRRKKS